MSTLTKFKELKKQQSEAQLESERRDKERQNIMPNLVKTCTISLSD